MTCLSLRGALASAFGLNVRQSPATSMPWIHNTVRTTRQHRIQNATASFSTSAPTLAKKGGKVLKDKRVTLIRYHLHHPTTLTPRPLRFSRNRALRHWTIHRAWSLYRMKIKKRRELELERQYNAMAAANEELRLGAGDGGRLFRKAQMKTGIWSIPERGGGIPIEYARGQVDWMGTVAGGVGGPAKIWDHDWKRA